MKYRFLKGLMLGALWLACGLPALRAQNFSVSWFVVAGGGGTITNGSISMTGTFGQWDANQQPLTNGLFSLSSGFWSILQNPSPSVSSNVPLVITDTQITVAITSPVNNSSTASSNVLVKGTIKGNLASSQLELTVNSNAPALVATTTGAHGLLDWTYTAPLTLGLNVITAQTVNTNGTNIVVSAPATISVFYVTNPLVKADTSKLTLTVAPLGKGKISGEANNATLEINKVYTVKAAPVGNWIFTNWTMGTNTNMVLGTSPSLSFIMESNLAIQANFVTNPFTPVAGVYNGLFAPADGPTEATSGYLTATLAATSHGAYSAKLLLDGGTYPFSGTFDLDGDSEETVARTGKEPVEVVLHLDLDQPTPTDQMTGYVVNFASDGWVSTLLANRNVFSTKAKPASDFFGKYTVIISPGSGAPTNSPGGYSYATLNSTLAGLVTLSGSLADKSTISQSTTVSSNGSIPLYVSLYSKKGSIQGWLTLTNESTNQPTPVQMVVGTNLAWFKPPVAKSLYANGFTNTDLNATGSLYVAPKSKASAITVTNGTLTIEAANLATPLTFSNVVVTGSTLANADDSVKGTITASTGAVSLTFTEAGTKTTAKGVVLQLNSDTNAAGWFPVGTTTSGSFLLQP